MSTKTTPSTSSNDSDITVIFEDNRNKGIDPQPSSFDASLKPPNFHVSKTTPEYSSIYETLMPKVKQFELNDRTIPGKERYGTIISILNDCNDACINFSAFHRKVARNFLDAELKRMNRRIYKRRYRLKKKMPSLIAIQPQSSTNPPAPEPNEFNDVTINSVVNFESNEECEKWINSLLERENEWM